MIHNTKFNEKISTNDSIHSIQEVDTYTHVGLTFACRLHNSKIIKVGTNRADWLTIFSKIMGSEYAWMFKHLYKIEAHSGLYLHPGQSGVVAGPSVKFHVRLNKNVVGSVQDTTELLTDLSELGRNLSKEHHEFLEQYNIKGMDCILLESWTSSIYNKKENPDNPFKRVTHDGKLK